MMISETVMPTATPIIDPEINQASHLNYVLDNSWLHKKQLHFRGHCYAIACFHLVHRLVNTQTNETTA